MFLMWLYIKSHFPWFWHIFKFVFLHLTWLCVYFHYVILLVLHVLQFYFWFCIFCCFTSILNPTSFIFINEREYQPLTKFSLLNKSNHIFIWTKEAQITASLSFYQRNNVYSFFCNLLCSKCYTCHDTLMCFLISFWSYYYT